MYIRWRVMGFSYARGASSFNATSFSRSRTPALIVGRSPWIAAHALVGLSWLSKGLILRAKSGSPGTRADQGVCPTGKLSGIGVKLRFPGVQCGGRGGRAEARATRLVNFFGFFQCVAGGREAGGGLRKIHARTAADAAGHGLRLAGEPGVLENHLEQRAFLWQVSAHLEDLGLDVLKLPRAEAGDVEHHVDLARAAAEQVACVQKLQRRASLAARDWPFVP